MAVELLIFLQVASAAAHPDLVVSCLVPRHDPAPFHRQVVVAFCLACSVVSNILFDRFKLLLLPLRDLGPVHLFNVLGVLVSLLLLLPLLGAETFGVTLGVRVSVELALAVFVNLLSLVCLFDLLKHTLPTQLLLLFTESLVVLAIVTGDVVEVDALGSLLFDFLEFLGAFTFDEFVLFFELLLGFHVEAGFTDFSSILLH